MKAPTTPPIRPAPPPPPPSFLFSGELAADGVSVVVVVVVVVSGSESRWIVFLILHKNRNHNGQITMLKLVPQRLFLYEQNVNYPFHICLHVL